MKKKIPNIVVENGKIAFRNFAGAAGKFNPAGNRNFCLFLDLQLAETLIEYGWNIRWLESREEGEERKPYLQVAVRYESDPAKLKFNPKIILVSRKGKTLLDASTVNIVDWAEIENVDLTIRPFDWEVNGKSGVKAYLKNMYVTIMEDEFEAKYENPPDSAFNCVGGCGGCETCTGACRTTLDGHD